MDDTLEVNILDPETRNKIRVFAREKIEHAVLEISPSKMTTNTNVRWLVKEFATLFTPLNKRIRFGGGSFCSYTPEMDIWWEVVIFKGEVKFYLAVPDIDHIKTAITHQVMKTWKRCNIREVKSPIPDLDPETTEVSSIELEHNSVMSLDVQNPNYSPLDSILNTKHYLKEDDIAILQLGMRPLGESWNEKQSELYEQVKKTKVIPKKKGKRITKKDIWVGFANAIGLIAEELMNLIGDFLIPGWEDNRDFRNSLKDTVPKNPTKSTISKKSTEGFKIDFRLVAHSQNDDRRCSIIRSMSSGFHPLAGDNKLVEKPVKSNKQKAKVLKRVRERKITVRFNGNELGSLELAKIINVPDQKAQIEHYNELKVVKHRGEADVPKEVFTDDGEGIPFAKYEDTDGNMKEVYFSGKNKNLLCMPRVVIGEPGTGKTTFAQNFALSAFSRGYGAFLIDAADGKLVQRILDRVPKELRHKVKIIDFQNTEFPIGLGWNEIFKMENIDVIEDLIVEEVISYIELVSGSDLNMRARTWVEGAVKAVFVTPDATLQDVENMLNNANFRSQVIPTIEDPELRSDWEYYHEKLKPEERKTIYDEAFRRLAPVMRKKGLKNFILQKPKKDDQGDYLVDIRRWMDEGCLVLVKANETLGESLQTALVSFMLAKFNLAMISREDTDDEDDRHPCFLLLDEPDHYIKGSERWRNMLTRYRKYRCGLVFMFHGWAQLKKTDRGLPEIMRQAGPHYVIFQTDEKNLEELRPIIEPDFKISDIAKGMPQHHAVIRMKMFTKDGDLAPAFMVKGRGKTEELFGDVYDEDTKEYSKFNNNDLYEKCALELGRPKQEVMEALFRNKSNGEFSMQDTIQGTSTEGEGNLDDYELVTPETDEDEVEEERRLTRKKMEREVGEYIQKQMDEGNDEDLEELVEVMEDILEEG